EFHEQVAKVPQPLVAEHIKLEALLPGVFALGVASAQDAMPEESDLFFQRPLGVDHAEDPLFLLPLEGILVHPFGLVPQHDILVEVRLRFRVQQLLDSCLVPFLGTGFQLGIWCSESGAAHQVSHESNRFICHFSSPSHSPDLLILRDRRWREQSTSNLSSRILCCSTRFRASQKRAGGYAIQLPDNLNISHDM